MISAASLVASDRIFLCPLSSLTNLPVPPGPIICDGTRSTRCEGVWHGADNGFGLDVWSGSVWDRFRSARCGPGSKARGSVLGRSRSRPTGGRSIGGSRSNDSTGPGDHFVDTYRRSGADSRPAWRGSTSDFRGETGGNTSSTRRFADVGRSRRDDTKAAATSTFGTGLLATADFRIGAKREVFHSTQPAKSSYSPTRA